LICRDTRRDAPKRIDACLFLSPPYDRERPEAAKNFECAHHCPPVRPYNRARNVCIDSLRTGWDGRQGPAIMNAVAATEMIERAGRVLIAAAPAPAKVILFGSRARGDGDERSDFDFLVIENEVENRLAEAVRLRRALGDFNAPVDLIVMDAALAERRAKVKGTMVNRALREGRVLAES
jgi:uncharacterized protein